MRKAIIIRYTHTAIYTSQTITIHTVPVSESSSDDGLGHPSGGVGSGPVHLGGVLAAEGSASVGTPPAIGVNDDLTALGGEGWVMMYVCLCMMDIVMVMDEMKRL